MVKNADGAFHGQGIERSKEGYVRIAKSIQVLTGRSFLFCESDANSCLGPYAFGRGRAALRWKAGNIPVPAAPPSLSVLVGSPA